MLERLHWIAFSSQRSLMKELCKSLQFGRSGIDIDVLYVDWLQPFSVVPCGGKADKSHGSFVGSNAEVNMRTEYGGIR